MVSEPIAAAVGIKIEIDKPVGCMVVDIGGGTTEIAIIALSGIVCNQSIRIAGDTFNQEIVHHMRQKHNLLIGERTGEEIKIAAGACVEKLNEEVADYEVRGRDLMTGIPEVVKVSYKEIAISLDKSISKIEDAILKALEIAPPELSSDIYLNGIHLTGGGALLRGLNTRIEQKTKLKVHIAEDPLRAVVRGTGIISQNLNKFKAVLLS